MRDFVKALRKNFEAKVKAKKVKLDTSCCKCGRKPEEVKQLELHHVVPICACPPERKFNPNVQGNLIIFVLIAISRITDASRIPIQKNV